LSSYVIPTHWESKKFCDVTKNLPLTGRKLLQRDYLDKGKFPVIDQGQGFIGGFTDEDLVVTNELPVIIFGDHTKVLKFVDFPFVAGADGIKVFRVNEEFIPKFFFYFLKSVELPNKGYARHYQYLQNELIPIPPMEEQEKIVSKIEELFSQLDAGVAGLKRVQELLKQYRASVLKAAFEGRLVPQNPNDEPAEEMLRKVGKSPVTNSGTKLLPKGWCWTIIGDVIQPIKRRVNPQEHPELLFIGMEHIEAQTMRLLGTVKAQNMRSLADSFLSGDVLYGRLRPYLNKVYCPDFSGLCSTEFIVFPKNPLVNSKYLQYFLNRRDFVEYATRLNTGDRPRVKFEQFSSHLFPLPPLVEQTRIVEVIEMKMSVVDKVENTINSLLFNSNKEKQSILKSAFEGNLIQQRGN